MSSKITIDVERCKGCELCVVVCPKSCITISRRSNKKGYFPAEVDNSDCTGCTICAIICPDTAIVVYRDGHNVVELSGKKKGEVLIEEKR